VDYVYVVLGGFGSVSKEGAGESVETTKLNDNDNDKDPKAVVMWVRTRVRAKVCVNVGNEGELCARFVCMYSTFDFDFNCPL
jgi:hypothetical protein